MQEPEGSLTGTTTLKTLIDHYEWMVSAGKIKVGGAGWKRLLQLKERRKAEWNAMRRKYGKSYQGKL